METFIFLVSIKDNARAMISAVQKSDGFSTKHKAKAVCYVLIFLFQSKIKLILRSL